MIERKAKLTFVWLCLLIVMAELWRFFTGMEKVDIFLLAQPEWKESAESFVEVARYPSNIFKTLMGQLGWLIVLWRISAHRMIPDRMVNPFIWLALLEILEYILFCGQMIGFVWVSFGILLIMYNLKKIGEIWKKV